MENKALLVLFFTLCFHSCFVIVQSYGNKQIEALTHLHIAKFKKNSGIKTGHFEQIPHTQGVRVLPQAGLIETDRIERLPEVKFSHYGGYVTVNESAGRAFFYYFAEAQRSKESVPLLLWLNGGPGCSSLAYGAMQELGPFRVHSDGKTLYKNNFAWNHGESYAGHYVPQLAHTILHHNKRANKTIINLKGIIIGNAVINDETDVKGMFDYFTTHALISEETWYQVNKYCDFSPNATHKNECNDAVEKAEMDIEDLDIYNIYAPVCTNSTLTAKPKKISYAIDPCSDFYVHAYLNRPDVQKALHANVTRLDHD